MAVKFSSMMTNLNNLKTMIYKFVTFEIMLGRSWSFWIFPEFMNSYFAVKVT